MLQNFDLEPKLDWPKGIREHWNPGNQGAEKSLKDFLKSALHQYDDGRNLPFERGTSRLSPHLHFGEISIRRVWHEVKKYAAQNRKQGILKSAEIYLKELGWREFAHHLLYHFPHTVDQPLRPEFLNFPWSKDKKNLRAWQKGKTGYPIVDAGMRELWKTGWMHNRVRMIVASFLVKDLLIAWQEGAKWFWDTLVDADLANNTLGWQWTAGCGADAAPYFRIFNPVSQGEKFDSEGAYIQKWVPELKGLNPKWIHKPWQAPLDVLSKAGIKIGQTYPAPIVDHAHARKVALYTFQKLKK